LKTPIIAVQAAVCLHDISAATSTAVLFQQLGPVLFIGAAQTVILNQLLPQIQATNPDLTAMNITQAGATGLKTLVTESQLPAVLVDYADSIDWVFRMATGLAATASVLAFAIELKSVKKDKANVLED